MAIMQILFSILNFTKIAFLFMLACFFLEFCFDITGRTERFIDRYCGMGFDKDDLGKL